MMSEMEVAIDMIVGRLSAEAKEELALAADPNGVHIFGGQHAPLTPARRLLHALNLTKPQPVGKAGGMREYPTELGFAALSRLERIG